MVQDAGPDIHDKLRVSFTRIYPCLPGGENIDTSNMIAGECADDTWCRSKRIDS